MQRVWAAFEDFGRMLLFAVEAVAWAFRPPFRFARRSSNGTTTAFSRAGAPARVARAAAGERPALAPRGPR